MISFSQILKQYQHLNSKLIAKTYAMKSISAISYSRPYLEFMIALTFRQECREAFDLFDLDGSGEIDEQELKSSLHLLMHTLDQTDSQNVHSPSNS